MSVDWQYSDYSKIYPEIVECFPFEKAREGQLETVSEIYEAILNGYKYIVLEAGTGTGKSVIAATLARKLENAYILTMTKQLQSQYLDDFEDYGFTLVKGKGNFRCSKYKEDSITESCDMGRCVLEGYRCEYKTSPFNFEKCNNEKVCPFILQKSKAIQSDVIITNYAYAFVEFNFNQDFHKRELLVCDEAHNLESRIMDLLSLEFNLRELKEEAGISLSEEKLDSLNNEGVVTWVDFIDEITKSYEKKSEKLKSQRSKNTKAFKRLKNINKRIDDFKRFVAYIQKDPNNWIIDYDSYSQRISFKPIRIDNYAKETLLDNGDICLFMSASILDYGKFAKWLGIDEDEIYAIRRKSPFNLARNPIKTYDGLDMSYRNLKANAPRTIPVIRDILERHKNEKGIIHTVSYSCKDYLMEELDDDRLIDHNTRNRAKVLRKFERSRKPLVLVSPSMGEGVDLPGDKCRFQIIYTIPYPNIQDKQTKARKRIEPSWYDYQTVISIVQTYGRGMRSEDDYCKTYFIDSRLDSYISKDSFKNRFFPADFIEAINIEPAIIEDKSGGNVASRPKSRIDDEFIDESKVIPTYRKAKKRKPKVSSSAIDKSKIKNPYIKENFTVDDFSMEELFNRDDDFEESDIVSASSAEVKEKNHLKLKGRKLNSIKRSDEFIPFFESMIGNELFVGDYYPYRQLAIMYSKLKDSESLLEIILRFFKSGIYCNNYNFLWFVLKINQIEDYEYDLEEVLSAIEYFKSHGAVNKSKTHVVIADRIISKDDEFSVKSKEDHIKMHKKYEFEEIGRYLKNLGTQTDFIKWYRDYVENYDVTDYSIFATLATAYHKEDDFDGELNAIIQYYYNCNKAVEEPDEDADRKFTTRLNKLNVFLMEPMSLDEIKMEAKIRG